ncbi:MAG TPA: hypothetical protein VEX41_00840 [Candidatus Eisenbacteria bacterium]|nr:hypothetical protein [Candidatus Eisenbacteria bacterium]
MSSDETGPQTAPGLGDPPSSPAPVYWEQPRPEPAKPRLAAGWLPIVAVIGAAIILFVEAASGLTWEGPVLPGNRRSYIVLRDFLILVPIAAAAVVGFGFTGWHRPGALGALVVGAVVGAWAIGYQDAQSHKVLTAAFSAFLFGSEVAIGAVLGYAIGFSRRRRRG